MRYFVLLCLSMMLLSGCATRQVKPLLTKVPSGELAETYYQMRTQTPDGITLSFTVYQPRLSAHHTAPLILHTHGFGVSRMKRPWLDLYGSLMPTGEAAQRAWHNGYWVISYDQRGHGGFGGSEGQIRVTDPDKEVQDVSTLMNWAEQHLPQLARNANGVRAGMIGESYGGGVQYIASAKDKRLQALVPVTTWYDLESSLAPNGIPKSGWISVLSMADWWNWNRFDPSVKQAIQDSKKGRITLPTYTFLKTHQARWFCENQQPPQGDALIIQGFRDILFPFNESVRASHCLQKAGRDVRIIGSSSGHLQPWVQKSPAWKMPIWYLEKTINCHQQQFNIQTMISQWFDAKLKDQTETLQQIPTLCVEDSPVSQLSELQPVDRYPFAALPIKLENNIALRVPLVAIQKSGWITGIPRLTLSMTSNHNQPEPILFVSLGAWKKGSARYRILNEQTTPISIERLKQRNTVAQQLRYPLDDVMEGFDLFAVNSALKEGEILGLVISSRSRYYGSSSQKTASTTIEGFLELPRIIDKAN